MESRGDPRPEELSLLSGSEGWAPALSKGSAQTADLLISTQTRPEGVPEICSLHLKELARKEQSRAVEGGHWRAGDWPHTQKPPRYVSCHLVFLFQTETLGTHSLE